MILSVEEEETYCLKSQSHVPYDNGSHIVCYRCGMLLGPSDSPKLGSLLDV